MAEVEAMKRELHVWEGMTVRDKGMWLEFQGKQGVRPRSRSVAGVYWTGVVLM